MADLLIVSSKMKDFIKAEGCKTAGDVSEALSKYIERALSQAVARARANGRRTVRASDL